MSTSMLVLAKGTPLVWDEAQKSLTTLSCILALSWCLCFLLLFSGQSLLVNRLQLSNHESRCTFGELHLKDSALTIDYLPQKCLLVHELAFCAALAAKHTTRNLDMDLCWTSVSGLDLIYKLTILEGSNVDHPQIANPTKPLVFHIKML